MPAETGWIARARGYAARHEKLAVLLLAATSVLLRLPFILRRELPTVFGDEALYVYKARNFFEFGSYLTPEGVPDCASFAAPLYSLLLAPVFLLAADPLAGYRWMLIVNSLLLAAGLVAVHRIAAAEFPERRGWITAAGALWCVPGVYAQVLLSEALFLPLFLWSGVAYLRCARRPSAGSYAVLGAVLSLLALTRNAGLAILPFALLLVLLSGSGRAYRVGRWREIAPRLPALLLPLATTLAWRGWLTQRVRRPPHSVTDLALAIDGLEGGLATVGRYLGIWAAQIAYVNLATLGLLTILGVCLIGRHRADGGADRPTLGVYWLLSCLALATPGTLLMLVLPLHVPRSAVYGRLVDMVVPVVLVYGLGLLRWPVFASRPASARDRFVRLVMAFVAAAALAAAVVALPRVLETRALSPGLAWLSWFHGLRPPTGATLAWSIVLPALFLLAAAWRRARLPVGAVVAVLGLLGWLSVLAQHREAERIVGPRLAAIERVVARDGRVFYPPVPSQEKFWAQFLLHAEALPIDEHEGPLGDEDGIIVGGRLLLAVQPGERLGFALGERGVDLLFEGFGAPREDGTPMVGDRAAIAFRLPGTADEPLWALLLAEAPAAAGEPDLFVVDVNGRRAARWRPRAGGPSPPAVDLGPARGQAEGIVLLLQRVPLQLAPDRHGPGPRLILQELQVRASPGDG